jgi:HAD superfamily hydrolase (TIGR01509 family)
MIKAIIFDCFGVLAVDGWGPFKERYFRDKPEAFAEVAALGKLVDAGKCSVDILILTIARNLQMSNQQVREAINRREPHEELFAYIRTTLKPKYKIGLLSNASYDIRTELFTPAQNQVFDASVLSYDVGMTKSDPAMYAMILQELGVQPHEAILVDDQVRYCEAAKSAGMQAIVYTSCQTLQKQIKSLE